MIPRSNDVVVGGTSEPDNWNLAVDDKTDGRSWTAPPSWFLSCARRRSCELASGCGRRRPEVRCELVEATAVIHCYGHGGSGVTLSWGCADEVLTGSGRV